ncbi:MAG: long-chain acyl-CoA synthetase [Ancylomarina sp.]|jgi:long-chain acyl-CoA synthetase
MNVFDFLFSDSKILDKYLVLGPKESISYRQIYQDSIRLANYLKNKIGEEKHIILASENSVFFITAYLGILKSGHICIPIDPTIEQSNLDYIIRSTESDCIIYSNRFNKLSSTSALNQIDESQLGDIIKYQTLNGSAFSDSIDRNKVAEILFTSGSTGIPKGVIISHQNIIANTNSILSYLNLGAKDIMGVVLPFYYCYGLSLLHTHIKVGASLVLINNFIFLASVIDNLKEYKCTGFAGVPSHFQILLKKSETFRNTVFPELRYVTQAGGKLHDMFIKDFINTFPNIQFFVMYGQTEATARLSYLPPDKLREKIGSIGKAIPGVTLSVLDEVGNKVNPGKIGEIVASGDNIMQGYYKDDEGTRSVLKDGYLYTGDLGKLDEDSFIFLESRKKEIIKVGGKRVSPKEIEAVILSITEVIDCTIESVYDDLLGESIKASIVLNKSSNQEKIKEEIIRLCHHKLLAYKIPKFWSIEKNLNLSLTGKKIKNQYKGQTYTINHEIP